MYYKEDISFKTQASLTLRGWLFSPQNMSKPVPGIIMTHGFSALKEHYLEKFAKVFVASGFYVLVYDNRNFGESEGEPRFEVDPGLQVSDMQDAITFMQSLPGIDATKIGLWGTSFSGGNVMMTAAIDKRVACVVAQVPFVKGHHAFLKAKCPDIWDIIQKKYVMDSKARALGKSPALTPVVTLDPEKAVVMKQREAYEFFTSIPIWENKVTLKSLENSGEYAPIDFIQAVSPVPLLLIIADQDTICLTDLALAAYEKALPPKKCVRIKGHHFATYHEAFDVASKEACDWFKQALFV